MFQNRGTVSSRAEHKMDKFCVCCVRWHGWDDCRYVATVCIQRARAPSYGEVQYARTFPPSNFCSSLYSPIGDLQYTDYGSMVMNHAEKKFNLIFKIFQNFAYSEFSCSSATAQGFETGRCESRSNSYHTE